MPINVTENARADTFIRLDDENMHYIVMQSVKDGNPAGNVFEKFAS